MRVAEKDIAEKILESYNDVFADIINGALFGGREVLKPEELADQAPRYGYKADGKVRDIERDVAKRWVKENIRIACIGIENQTDADKDMPLRVIAYDGAEYRTELKGKDRYPVVTIVLYFGHEHRWNQPLNLLGCFDVPEEFRPYVNDYKVNLLEVAYLTPEQVRLFKSDFRIVADYFVQMRMNDDYVPSEENIRHVQEVLQLLSVMTGDNRFETVISQRAEGGTGTMSDVLTRIENRGIEKGRAEGRAEGRIEGIFKSYFDLVNDGILSAAQAAQRLSMTEHEFRQKMVTFAQ